MSVFGQRFLLRHNTLRTTKDILDYFFSKQLFTNFFSNANALKDTLKKQHIVKYEGNYYRIGTIRSNNLILYPILSTPNKIL